MLLPHIAAANYPAKLLKGLNKPLREALWPQVANPIQARGLDSRPK